MNRKKPDWTEPGMVVDRAAIDDALETRKGTAADHPVLSLAPGQGQLELRPQRPAESTAQADGHVPDTRSPAEIEAEIAATRQRLADTLDELTERLSPRGVMRQANSSARGVFVAPDGSVRTGRAVIAGGTLAAVVFAWAAARTLRR